MCDCLQRSTRLNVLTLLIGAVCMRVRVREKDEIGRRNVWKAFSKMQEQAIINLDKLIKAFIY